MCLLLSHVFSLIPVYSRNPAYWETGWEAGGGATAGEGVDRTPGPSAKGPRRWDSGESETPLSLHEEDAQESHLLPPFTST